MSHEARKLMAGWIAAIADNVKNPIASLAATLDTIESQLGDADAARVSIATARDRLAALDEYISELADFAHPASVNKAKRSLLPLIEAAIDAAHLPPSCDLDLEIDTSLQAPVDGKQLVRAIKAILRNGYEAVDPSETPRLLVKATKAGVNGNAILLSVDDNGPGLKPAVASEAFEPFFTTKEAGTGLGLTLAKKYLDAHGGSILIKTSQALGGCRIEMTIPTQDVKPHPSSTGSKT